MVVSSFLILGLLKEVSDRGGKGRVRASLGQLAIKKKTSREHDSAAAGGVGRGGLGMLVHSLQKCQEGKGQLSPSDANSRGRRKGGPALLSLDGCCIL